MIEPLPSENRYKVTRRIRFVIGGIRIEVPPGFVTDGATIPRPFWLTTGTPYAPRHIRAAIIHDYLYRSHAVNRKTADLVFRNILLTDGVNRYTAYKMYYALRAFGWIAWRM